MHAADMNAFKRSQMELQVEVREQLRVRPKLQCLFLEMTDACNLHCLHCGSNCTARNKTYLDLSITEKTLRQVAERYGAQNVMLCVTGGEPLLHPECIPFMERMHKLGFSWGMTSNGTLIDDATADRLMQSGLETVSISLDGLMNTNDWFRQKKGAFHKALKGITNLIIRGCDVLVTTVVFERNFSELDEMYELLCAHHVPAWRLINIEPIGRANAHPELQLSADDHFRLLDYIHNRRFDPEQQMEVTYGCSHFLPYEYERMVRDQYFFCHAGISVASILANGDIFACLDIERRPELIQGNIAADDFCEIWEHGFQVFRKDRTLDSNVCSTCSERNICAGDSFHTWDFDKKEPRLCFRQMCTRQEMKKYVLQQKE